MIYTTTLRIEKTFIPIKQNQLRKVLYTISSSATLASKQQTTAYGSFAEIMQPEIHESSSKLSSKSMRGQVAEGKERYCKECTAKFPRDRRLRLSANTAIQFYDVQDRLGYERPSEAIDWLMEKAKVAIEALANSPTQNQDATGKNSLNFQHQNQQHMHDCPINSLSLISEEQEPVLDSTPINFAEQAVSSATCLSDFNATEIGWFQMLSRNSEEEEEFVFNAMPQSPQPVVCQNQHNASNGSSSNCSPFHY